MNFSIFLWKSASSAALRKNLVVQKCTIKASFPDFVFFYSFFKINKNRQLNAKVAKMHNIFRGKIGIKNLEK